MQPWKILVVTHVAAGLTGFALAPRELLETEVESAGLFTTDTKRVLAAAVKSLKAENRLLVYTYKGASIVSIERTKLWVMGGRQELFVPAAVGYFVDFARLRPEDVTYDPRANVLDIALPKLVLGDIAFHPEAARVTNSGLLTFSQVEVEDLLATNYLNARRAVVKQAQDATLVASAERHAVMAVEGLLSRLLLAPGRPVPTLQVRFSTD